MAAEHDLKSRLITVLQAAQIQIEDASDWSKGFAELGILLDSIGVLQLTIGIENEFDFEVLPEHLKSGIFDSPAALLTYIEAQLAGQTDA